MENGQFNFDFSDVEPVKQEVKIGRKRYVMYEPSIDAATKYKNAMLRCTKLGPNGKPLSMDGMADCDPLLVSLCTFEVDDKGQDRVVNISTVRSWRNAILQPMAEWLKKIGQLDKDLSAADVEKQIKELQERLSQLRPDTIESLDKEIKELTAKQSELRKAKAVSEQDEASTDGNDTRASDYGGDELKNSPAATAAN